jgi:hypothetical protein
MNKPQRKQLRENLISFFSLDEIRTLCFDLKVDYDSLSGENKPDKVRELILHVERLNRLEELISLCKSERPLANWNVLNTSSDVEDRMPLNTINENKTSGVTDEVYELSIQNLEVLGTLLYQIYTTVGDFYTATKNTLETIDNLGKPSKLNYSRYLRTLIKAGTDAKNLAYQLELKSALLAKTVKPYYQSNLPIITQWGNDELSIVIGLWLIGSLESLAKQMEAKEIWIKNTSESLAS